MKILLIILSLIILYQIYNCNNIEKFSGSNTIVPTLPPIIVDIESYNNLVSICKKIINEWVTIPGSINIAGSMTVNNGSMTINGSLNILPTGIIVAWNGTSIPPGWVICDGTHNTPNLVDQFIYGSNTPTTTPNTGGTKTVSYQLKSTDIPPHSHTIRACNKYGGDGYNNPAGGETVTCNKKYSFNNGFGMQQNFMTHEYGNGNFKNPDTLLHDSTRNFRDCDHPTGGGKCDGTGTDNDPITINIIPPYYKLVYIMKTQQHVTQLLTVQEAAAEQAAKQDAHARAVADYEAATDPTVLKTDHKRIMDSEKDKHEKYIENHKRLMEQRKKHLRH